MILTEVQGVKILVIEDDRDIEELLQFFLEDNGYQVAIARDGLEGITMFREGGFSLILLDIMLPKIDGYAVCELVRKESDIHIIMVTALSDEEDQMKGLDLLADDYITKPFSMPVLLRKIGAVLRRSQRNQKGEANRMLLYQQLRLDLDNYQVFVAGEETSLTKREFEILKMLLENQGKVMTREILLEQLWQYEFYGNDRVVDNHIKNLRRKLGGSYIETVKGVGYRIAKLSEKPFDS
ncbi:MAG: response regulator transcription factor [Enterocloster sp.]|jgi:two-component system, OmpR family, response regulator VanR|nr:response regulator transcription factor [Enterocloster sp.]